MTKNKTPEMFRDLMQMFDPANFGKAFDPAAMFEKLGAFPGNLDAQDAIEKSKGQFETMAKANEAAAQSYRDLIEKQMEIFRDLTSEATEQAKAGPPQDVSTTYQQAVQRALEIMTELSNAARDANAQALDAIKVHVDQALKNPKS